jgi:hypothetical protein
MRPRRRRRAHRRPERRAHLCCYLDKIAVKRKVAPSLPYFRNACLSCSPAFLNRESFCCR